ncbi:MAG: adenosylcobinamide-GDP ribazoletransferase [Nostocoides sp.]
MIGDAWRLALGTLTAIPVTPPGSVDRARAGAAMLLAPVAALPLGVAAALTVLAGHTLGLPLLVVALLAIGVAVMGSRAIHLDGLSDVADGLAASYDREKSLAVMKSGTSGPAGVVATVLVLGLQVGGLAGMLGTLTWWRAAVLAGVAVCLSRAALAWCCVRGMPAARQDGLGRAYTQTVPPLVAGLLAVAAALVLSLVGWWAGLAWWRGAVAVGVAVFVVAVLLTRTRKRFGGVTGDVFGAGVELALTSLLVALS